MNVSKLMDDVKSSEKIQPDGLYLMKRNFEKTFGTTSTIYVKSDTEGHVVLYDRFFIRCKIIGEDTVIFNLGIYDNGGDIFFTQHNLENYRDLVFLMKKYNTLKNCSILCIGKSKTCSGTATSPKTIGQFDVLKAIGRMQKRNLYPNVIIVNSTGYSHIRKLPMFSNEFLYGAPIIDEGEMGSFEGLVVVVSMKCPPNFAFIAKIDNKNMDKTVCNVFLENIVNYHFVREDTEILRY